MKEKGIERQRQRTTEKDSKRQKNAVRVRDSIKRVRNDSKGQIKSVRHRKRQKDKLSEI